MWECASVGVCSSVGGAVVWECAVVYVLLSCQYDHLPHSVEWVTVYILLVCC